MWQNVANLLICKFYSCSKINFIYYSRKMVIYNNNNLNPGMTAQIKIEFRWVANF